MLDGTITFVFDGVEQRDVLSGSVNDLGGTLMEETISWMAGADNGSYKTMTDLRNIVAPLGRPLRQRTTLSNNLPILSDIERARDLR